MKARGPLVTKQNRSMLKTKEKTTSSIARSKESSLSKRQTFSGNRQQGVKQIDSDREKHHDLPEIWPSTEPPSHSYTTASCINGPVVSTLESSELDTQQDSVLARYLDRFRHGQPQSREERQQMAPTNREEQLPFWWASSLSMPPSSTPEKTNEEHRFPHHNRSPSSCKGSFSILSDASQCDVDTEILQLQERASRLLQKGEFSLCEEYTAVSSDGLGYSDFSSPVNSDEPVRRPMIPSLLNYIIAKDSVQTVTPSVIPTLASPIRPEEDPLFQWRLRRKMEKAKEGAQSQQHYLQSWQGCCQNQPLPSGNLFMPPQKIYPPDLSRETTQSQIPTPLTTLDQQPRATAITTVASNSLDSSPQALAYVPSHMHLLCDILPCPNQSAHPHVEESDLQKLDSHCTILPQTNCNSEIKHTSHTSPQEPLRTGSIEKDVHLHQTKRTLKKVNGRLKQPEKNEKAVPVLCKEQKKSSSKKSSGVYPSQKVSKEISTTTEQHQQIDSYTDSNMKSTVDGAPPPSPIYVALQQVVSEVLFPSTDSSPTQRIPPASSSPSCCVSAPPQYNRNDSIGVISQLLQEAEDSDEKEFEDDPLLKVLRKQRKWVKEQIIQVDTLLK